MDNKKKKQEFEVKEDFEIEESNAMKILKAKGEADVNPHESNIEARKIGRLENFWYQHKWHAGLIIAAIVIGGVLLYQLNSRGSGRYHNVYRPRENGGQRL